MKARKAAFPDPHEATAKVLTQGEFDLGLFDRDQCGTLEDAIQHRHYSARYMHRTGHRLGMEVRNCGSYGEPAEMGHKECFGQYGRKRQGLEYSPIHSNK